MIIKSIGLKGTVASLTLLCAATAAEARCVKHTGASNGKSIATASAAALTAWVEDARKRGPEFADWAKAKNMEVACKKVISGSGRARGPMWMCEATGSSTDVAGGENCPK